MDLEPLLEKKKGDKNRRHYGTSEVISISDEENEQAELLRLPSDDEEPMYSANEFSTVRQETRGIVTGRMRKKLAARLIGGEFQARRLKRRVYVCCISSELNIQDLHDHCYQQVSEWKIRLYGDALCLSHKKGAGGTRSNFDIPRRSIVPGLIIPNDTATSKSEDSLGFEFLEESKSVVSPLAKHPSKNVDTGNNDIILDDVRQEIFIFEFGAVVFWGFSVGEENGILQVIKDFSKRSDIDAKEFESSEDDMAFVAVADISNMRIANDMISLPEDSTVKRRLSISYAIAQSSVVSIFEKRIEEKVTEYKFIPETLSKSGKIDLSTRRIGMMIGDIFVIRHDLNLHTDILDTPDYFWEEDRYEGDYERVVKYLEVDTRVEVINKRLDMLKELLDVLHTQMENAHSTKLEWIIIWLVVIEVVIQLVGSTGAILGFWVW